VPSTSASRVAKKNPRQAENDGRKRYPGDPDEPQNIKPPHEDMSMQNPRTPLRQIARAVNAFSSRVQDPKPVDIYIELDERFSGVMNELTQRMQLMNQDWVIHSGLNEESRPGSEIGFVVDESRFRQGHYDGRIPKGATVLAVQGAEGSRGEANPVPACLFVGMLAQSETQGAGPLEDQTQHLQQVMGVRIAGQDLLLLREFDLTHSVSAILRNVAPRLYSPKECLDQAIRFVKHLARFA
jgi:hypothetical protein